jgi:hypothetical protein
MPCRKGLPIGHRVLTRLLPHMLPLGRRRLPDVSALWEASDFRPRLRETAGGDDPHVADAAASASRRAPMLIFSA